MKKVSPDSVHAKSAEFFAESLSTSPESIPDMVGSSGSIVSLESSLPNASAPEIMETPEGKLKGEGNRLSVDAKGWHSDLSGQIDSKGMSLGLDDNTDSGPQTHPFAVVGPTSI